MLREARGVGGKERDSQQVVMHSVCLVSGGEDYTGMTQVLLSSSNENMAVIIPLRSCGVLGSCGPDRSRQGEE